MGSLNWTTYVAAAKPVVSDHVPPGEAREMWSPTSSTLIYGDRDAVLVDALMTMGEGQALAGWVAAHGRDLTTIYITHGHGDHFFGAAAVLERFPLARLVATASVVDRMREQVSEQWLDGFWRTRFPGQIAERPPIAEPTRRPRSMCPVSVWSPPVTRSTATSTSTWPRRVTAASRDGWLPSTPSARCNRPP
jgi:hypothetical protein